MRFYHREASTYLLARMGVEEKKNDGTEFNEALLTDHV